MADENSKPITPELREAVSRRGRLLHELARGLADQSYGAGAWYVLAVIRDREELHRRM